MCAIRNTVASPQWYGDVRVGCYRGAVREETAGFQAYCGEESPRFVNRAELEVAKLLDYYRVPWQYEPRMFVLETDGEGRVREATRPDFYLPEQDLYLEITTMKQSLVTRKNRKIRKLRERYPEIRVKLFYKRDFERLVRKYGIDSAA
jgi:hypoxanthine phosphoribosyltransferase